MLFRVFAKGELHKLFGLLAREGHMVGPVRKARSHEGHAIHAFEPLHDFSQMDLGYHTTMLSAKRFFLPYREDLATFDVNNGDWTKHAESGADRPLVLFGLHACDINALNKLDKVLLMGPYPMPQYAARRKNMFIVGVGCMPRPACFCRSMGADTALHGFDLFLTNLGTKYFAEIQTDTAFNYLKAINPKEPTEHDHELYRESVARRRSAFTTQVDTTDLTKILDMEFQNEVWEQWGEKCLSCGTCANVCPTCYCYGVKETVAPSLKSARKQKTLYSCNLVDFAQVAGGHNFRPESHTRLKYRYYHKHRGFVEAYEEPLCVGCGRCGESCLAGITVPEVIASIREVHP
jgi:sulfhydrogenase subunit beta (sulfur reductase)